jgi:hypothetical protein
MSAVRVAHFVTREGAFIVAPLAATYEDRPLADRYEMLVTLIACVNKRKRNRLDGEVMIASLQGRSVKYYALPNFKGPYPQLAWLQLLSMLNEHIKCADTMLAAQLAAPYEYQLFITRGP